MRAMLNKQCSDRRMKGHSDRLLAIPARRALRKLGEDLRDARRAAADTHGPAG